MEFLVLGYDGSDYAAMDRRLAARENHLNAFDEFTRQGVFKYGGALLDDNQKMIGSMIVCEFASLDELKDKWLNHEPYMLGGVWQKVDIKPIRSRIPTV